MSNDAVVVENLTRIYRPRRGSEVLALDRISLTVPYGQVHGLLGPNGAGKTTLVKILSTVLAPTSGRALVCGHDVTVHTRLVKPRIGIVFGGERGLYTRLSGRQNLRYWAALYRLPRAEISRRTDSLLDRVGLADRADERVETYSRGMKQRLHLARGLIADASVLFLDEPATGLDPVAAREFRRLVEQLRTEGRTVLLTTHDMAEAEALCDRVTLIDHGRILATESPRTLAFLATRRRYVTVDARDAEALGQLDALPGVDRVDRDGNTIRIHVDHTDALEAVLRLLVESGVTTLCTSPPGLEEVYLDLIGDRGLAV